MRDLTRCAPSVLLMLATLTLGGCGTFLKKNQPVSSVNRIQPHESWCYSTLGEIDCYTQPQRVPPGRLVNVDPQSRLPLTPQDHAEAVAQGQ